MKTLNTPSRSQDIKPVRSGQVDDTQPVRSFGIGSIFSSIAKSISSIFGGTSETEGLTKQIRAAAQEPKVRAEILSAVETVAGQRGMVPRQKDKKPVQPKFVSATRSSAIGSLRSSSQSLQTLLDEVWENRDAVSSGQLRPYRMYCQAHEVNQGQLSAEVIVDGLAAIAKNRPPSAVSNTQGLGGSGDSISDIAEMFVAGELPENGLMGKNRIASGFFRFQRANWQPDAIQERVYINARADSIPHLMSQIVENIVDQAERFPGVEMAKCAGPAASGNRSENIVIYTHGAEATKRVLAEIKRLQAKTPKSFMKTVPQMTRQVSDGVATGAEPAHLGGRASFGSIRAEAISSALRTAEQNGLDREGFGKQVDLELQRRGVDPRQPHLNLERSKL